MEFRAKIPLFMDVPSFRFLGEDGMDIQMHGNFDTTKKQHITNFLIHLTLIQLMFHTHPTVGGGGRHDGPMRGKLSISNPFMDQFSKFLCLVKACENRHSFLLHE